MIIHLLWISDVWARYELTFNESESWFEGATPFDPYSHIRLKVIRRWSEDFQMNGEFQGIGVFQDPEESQETDTETFEKRFSIMLNTRRRVDHRLVVQFELGMPSQRITAELDWNLYGLYIAEAYVGFLPFSTKEYLDEGVFFPQRSRTYTTHSVNLLDGQTKHRDHGTWGTDDLIIGPQTFESMRFLGIDPPLSKLGLGPPDSFSITKKTREEKATNFFCQLKNKGIAAKIAFSLWIGDNNSESRGVLLSSVIDYRYAISQFYIFPLLGSPVNKPGYYIKLDAIVLISAEGHVETIAERSMMAKLDISTARSKLPEDIILAIHERIGYAETEPVMRCGLITYGSIGFVFSGIQFDIPFKDIMREHRYGQVAGCSSPFKPDKHVVLGANILSMLYMVFDLESKELGLAMARMTKEKTKKDRLMVILSDKIPGIRPESYSKTRIYHTWSVRTKDFDIEDPKVLGLKMSGAATTMDSMTLTVTQLDENGEWR